MALRTMAIVQNLRGDSDKLDLNTLLPGQIAFASDNHTFYACFAPGDIRHVATYEEMIENINSATQDVQAMFTAEVREAIRQAADATETATGKIGELQVALDSIGDATDRADAAAEAAEQYVMGDISEKIVTFTEAETKEDLKSGEPLATLFGKIKKWLCDLKAKDVSYEDAATGLNSTDMQSVINAICNRFTPSVGDIEFNVTGTNPNKKYPGTTWTEWGKGQVPVGVNPSDSDFITPEKTGGSKTHTLAAGEIPAHSHSVNAVTAGSNGAHTHTLNYTASGAQSGSGVRYINNGGDSSATYANENGAHTHSVPAHNTNSTGSGNAHNNMQPYITCYMWKRTA